jgi:DNA repair protein SbcC/Rad50
MITYLRLENFLRHEDTELHFSPEQQLVVVSGNNGAGKTAVFGAVVYALYGEAPKGRRIDELVRWGAELEGMTVELEFTIGEDVYRVRRRRDGVKSSSTLHLNGAQVVDGAKAVTSYVTKLLGMDVAGFRLAFVAEQGELDGLASLRPGERAKMLSRMLRLDAIEAARHRAREIYNNERKVVHALGHGLDLDELAQTLEQTTAERDLFAKMLDDSKASAAALAEELAASADVEIRWQQASTALARAEAVAEAARAEQARAQQTLERLSVPAAPSSEARPEAQVAADLGQLTVAIVKAEADLQLVQQRRMAEQEVERAETRLVEISSERSRLLRDGDVDTRLKDASTRLDLAATRRREIDLDLEELRDDLAAATARRDLAAGQRQDLDELDATCDRCGQDVGDDHRHRMAEGLDQQVIELETHLAKLRERLSACEQALAATTTDASAAEQVREAAVAARSRLVQLDSEEQELARRRETYAGQVQRLTTEPVDIDALYARKGELSLEQAQAKAAESARAHRLAAFERQQELSEALASAARRVADADAALVAARPTQGLLDEHARRAELAAARDGELEIVTHLSAEHAGAVERVNAAERDLERANAALDRRRKHQLKAQTAENAALLLGEVGEMLATQIRPALQGAVSDLLARLSSGRFSEVEISDTYDVKVLDGGEMVDLSALSGGEQDLVALAVRLALAEVVTSRQGVAGIGTLVLDEVFGSQDAGRQQSIVTALRSLRDIYGQILLISHVGGLDEAADAVVTVTTSPDRTETEVSIS